MLAGLTELRDDTKQVQNVVCLKFKRDIFTTRNEVGAR